jgi:hypothetical protein
MAGEMGWARADPPDARRRIPRDINKTGKRTFPFDIQASYWVEKRGSYLLIGKTG